VTSGAPSMSNEMNAQRLIERQMKRATREDGSCDLELLQRLVIDAYANYERDRRRTDRSMTLMVDENERLMDRLHASLAAAGRDRARFEAAQENMVHGLSMFDAQDRLVVANRRFREMYGLERQDATLGASLASLLGTGRTHELLGGDAQAAGFRRLARIAARGHEITRELRLANGRIIETTLSPVKNGGWLAVHLDVTEQRAALARMAHMARHDALTELGNRILFHERLTEALLRVPKGVQVAVLCLDLDGFKSVNDTLGHPIGDRLLQEVAARLRGKIDEGDLVARLGGDEFAVVQSGRRQPEAAMRLATELIAAVGETYSFDGQIVRVGVSIGVSVAPDDTRDADTLLRNADIALFRAKVEGRNAARAFEPEMDARLRERRNLEIELRDAIANDQFELHYQPQINLQANRVTGFEALVRWRHPARGLLPPSAFLSLSEETGLIDQIGEIVLRRACKEAADWPDDIGVAVNVSPVQFRRKGLALTVVSALAESGLTPHRLDLEITETALMQYTESVLETLADLREMGVSISMDDFGTGYSSLSYLRNVPFDRIKIERSFIEDIDKSSESDAIVRAIVSLGRSLGISTIAEGVETPEQLDAVRELGCASVQGFVLSRAMPPELVRVFLAQHAAQRTDAAA